MRKRCKETADWTKHGRVFVGSTSKMLTIEYSLFFCYLSSSLIWNSVKCPMYDDGKKSCFCSHIYTFEQKHTEELPVPGGVGLISADILSSLCSETSGCIQNHIQGFSFKTATVSQNKNYKIQSIPPWLATSRLLRTPAHRQKLAVTQTTGIWEVRQSWGYHCGEEDSWAS